MDIPPEEQIVDAVSIRRTMPAEAEDRADSGSLGKAICWPVGKNSYIATLVER